MKSIYTNQVGFKTESDKKAVLNFDAKKFSVLDANSNVVFSGETTHFGTDDISGEDVYVADFSDLKASGRYCVIADGVVSASFEISDKPYEKLMGDLLKTYYFLRCGTGLDEEYAGVYKHGKCHTAKAHVYEDRDTLIDVTGGWHDAGDYGRYSNAGAVAVAHILYAVKMNPSLLDIKFNIPNEGKFPDVLEEVKVELDFLMKMMKEDGGVWHKVTTMRHADFIMPEEDVNDLFLFPVSSIATADVAAVCALASTIYKKYDEEYAACLLNASLKAYEWLSENPEQVLFKNPSESNTGEYGEAEDISNRFWAAAALYDATKDSLYKKEALFQKERLVLFDSELERKPYLGNVFACLGWAEVAGLGSLSFILGDDKDSFKDELIECFKKEADRLVEVTKKNGFDLCMEAKDFIWGSNMELGKYLMILTVVNRIFPSKEYAKAIQAGFDYLLGCNSMDVSYVTGNGEKAYKNPHLRPTAVDGIEDPWPGLVSGGPNRGLQDEKARELPKDSAPMKCFIDHFACYSLNEITIYWNSPIIFALAPIM